MQPVYFISSPRKELAIELRFLCSGRLTFPTALLVSMASE